MGEIAVATTVSEELVALGLGSCIGVAIVDWTAQVAGLAHVVLPESGDRTGEPGKFADTAVPALLRMLDRAGASPRRLEAAIAGGARMFESSGGLDIGARNAEAVRAALAAERITVRVARTGGSQGRTVRVSLAEGLVTVRVAGDQPEPLIQRSDAAGGSPLGASALRLGARAEALASGRRPPAPTRYGASGLPATQAAGGSRP